MSHRVHPCIAISAVVTVGAVGTVCYAYYIYNKSRKVKLPEEWTQVGTLSNIYIYPIKSCGPVIAEKAECSGLGLKLGWLRDRFLMVVNKNNNFVTARAYPELLLVKPTVTNSVLTLKHDDLAPLHVDLAEVVALQKPEKGTVWGTQVSVKNCGWEPGEWFSRLLDKSVDSFKLVYYASQQCRQLSHIKSKYWTFTKNDTGALPDEVPFNLINQASVDDLNTRLTEIQVTHRNFRPNFVLTGSTPYAEDKWKYIKIGDNVFEVIKPCTRCIMTTIDPETGVHNLNSEPLQTLKGYRQLEEPGAREEAGTSPRMGLQMTLRSGPGGMVALDQPVYVA